LKVEVIYSQVVYAPLYKDVYDFLEEMSARKIIHFNSEVKPIPRKDIGKYLKQIEANASELNSVELELLQWYKEDFAYELERKDKRWNLYQYSDSLFNIELSPVLGYCINSFDGKSGHNRTVGARIYTSYSDWFAADLNLRDKGEFGDYVDKEKSFSPRTGAWYKQVKNGIEYSDVNGSINFNWSWGSVSLIKDYLTWGYGNFGNLILSTKAPSYPQIRLELKPKEWFRFYYIHGWLTSLVPDSSYFYYNYNGSSQPQLRKKYKEKYIAANMLAVSPTDWLDVFLGNSIIYSSASPRPEFLIPFMFFKLIDHNMGRGSIEDGNGQIYFGISAKYPKSLYFYANVFLDVLEVRNILNEDFHNTWVGFTIGSKYYNLLNYNLDLNVEYTRINPWVYEHKDAVTTFKHLGYSLGHWLGQNADQFRFQIDYQPLRGLKTKAFIERIRKGGLKDIYLAYSNRTSEEFLYSPLRKELNLGIKISYEYLHDLFGEMEYIYSDIRDDDTARLLSYKIGKKSFLSVGVNYGF